MKTKNYIPEIPDDEPFKNDLLGRKKYADMLSQYIQNTEGGFALSLNASWGNGKTTFVKMWEAELKKKGYSTIYFNAWETDYAQDPFLALIDGLVTQLKSFDLLEDIQPFASAITDVLIKIAKSNDRIKWIGEIGQLAKEGVEKVIEQDTPLQEYRGYSELINDFKKKLKNLVEHLPNKKLIIFVDELDRCRPNYAVEMLERIKHFFSIDNIVFVLSVDKYILKKAICGIYNCDISDASNYLRRFIDLDFELPEPTATEFVNCLYQYHDFETVVGEMCDYWDCNRGTNSHLEIKRIIAKCFNSSDRTLRDIEKYFNRLDVILRAFPLGNEKYDKASVLYLVYIYIFHKEVYDKIRGCEYSMSELLAALEDIFAYKNMDSDLAIVILNIMMQMVLAYEEYMYIETRKETSLPDNFQFKLLDPKNFMEVYRRNKGAHNDATYFSYTCPIIEMVSNKFGER